MGPACPVQRNMLREQRFDQTEIGEAKYATISGLSPLVGEKPASPHLAAELRLPTARGDAILSLMQPTEE